MAIAAMIALMIALRSEPAVAAEPPWAPPGLQPTTATLRVLRPLPRKRRAELLLTTVGTDAAQTRVDADGRDERFATTISGAVFESGEHAGIGWTRTPWGLTQLGVSDDQGDPLDRWPRAVYGFDRADCTVVGQTEGDHPLIVVRDAPPRGVPHWFYVDPQSGTVVREIQRRGVSEADITFAADGSGWTVHGSGPDARIVRHTVAPSVAPAAFDPPPSRRGEPFVAPAAEVTLPFLENAFHSIDLAGTVNGRRSRLLLDSGTGEIVISRDAARAANVHLFLDHGIVGEIEVGGVRMRDVPVQAVDNFGADVILGYDFFVGHIIHVDYRNRRVSILARSVFPVPDGATRIDADYREGAPLVRARFSQREGERFLIDIGSPRILLSADFASEPAAIGFRTWRLPSRDYNFLEGALSVRGAEIGPIAFGGTQLAGPNEVTIQIPTTNGLPLPFDGILGTDLLGKFDLWFDADGGAIYVRPQ